jgi:hypothetical protein
MCVLPIGGGEHSPGLIGLRRNTMTTSAMRQTQTLRGRPARGRDGTKVRDYPTLLVRMEPSIRQLLAALAEVTGRSQSEMISDSLFMYQYNYLRIYELATHHRVQKRLSDLKKQANKRVNARRDPL